MKKLILFLSLILMFTGCIGYAAEEDPSPYTNYMVSHSPSMNHDGNNIYGTIEITCSRRMDSISSTYKLQKLSGGTWYDVAGTSSTYTEKNVTNISFEVNFNVTAPVAVAYRLYSVATCKLGTITDTDIGWDEIIM